MRQPKLNLTAQTRQTVQRFGGIERPPQLGRFEDLENLTSDETPAAATRAPRQRIDLPEDTVGCAVAAKEKLAYVLGSVFIAQGASVWYDGQKVAGLRLTRGDKQLVGMGAYLCIFPDKKYFNTVKPTDCGSMEAVLLGESVTLCPCDAEGTPRTYLPANNTPTEGSLRIADGALQRYDGTTWVATPAYVRLTCDASGAGFRAGDTVAVSDVQNDLLAGDHLVVKATSQHLILEGLLEEERLVSNVTVTRAVPDMDFVVQCRNRLWGCRYDALQGKNEIYCCALGDFFNWSRFAGTASDAWRASCGSDGPFTGAAVYGGCPLFFKEQCVHRVHISASGAHQLTETPCQGVQRGSGASLAQVGSLLYYHSCQGVMAYDGATARCVSQALGQCRFRSAIAGGFDGKYYLAVTDSPAARHPFSGGTQRWTLLVYDTERDLWHRESCTQPKGFAALRDALYLLCDEALYLLCGAQAANEGAFAWYCESGPIAWQQPERKYVSRLTLRLELSDWADLYVRYDDKPFTHIAHLRAGSRLVPLHPRRCDSFALRLEGVGRMRLSSASWVLERGSDR